MHRKTVGILLAVLLALAIAIPVAAITYGEPDVGEHPYVGLIAFYDSEGEFIWRCSGTLLSPTFMLTAGHCTAPDPDYGTPVSARVYFDETIHYDPVADDYTNPIYYMGTPVTHPNYDWSQLPEHYDIGVVLMDSPVPGITEFGELPTQGIMDEVGSKSAKRKVIVTSVGYGVNDLHPDEISLRTRYQAQSFLINLINAYTDGWNIMSSNNPGQWTGSEDYTTGGTCFGDSGGPVFLGDSESDLVVGITSFGNSGCAGADFSWRVDIQASLDFLSQFADDYGFVIP
jgi:secreted trypsin-like serine protease